METLEVIQKVQEQAQLRAKKQTAVYGTLAPGDWHAQGDVILLCLGKLPADAIKCKPDPKLAPGESRGSRHEISKDTLQFCEFYARDNPDVLTGKVFVTSDKVEVTHPDHGHVILPRNIIVQVLYQRQYAEELKKSED